MELFDLRIICQYSAEEVESYEADIIKIGSTHNLRNFETKQQTTHINHLNQPHKLEPSIQDLSTNISILPKETQSNKPTNTEIYLYSGDIRNNTNEHIESNIEGRYLGIFNIEPDDALSSPGRAYTEIWGEETSPENEPSDLLTEPMLEEYKQTF